MMHLDRLMFWADSRINGIVGSAQRVYETLRRSEIAAASEPLQDEIETFVSAPVRALAPGTV